MRWLASLEEAGFLTVRECPARDVIGISTVADLKSVVKTSGVHAPADKRIRVVGISDSVEESVYPMQTHEISSRTSVPTERIVAGWWIWTPSSLHLRSKNWHSFKGSLYDVSVILDLYWIV